MLRCRRRCRAGACASARPVLAIVSPRRGDGRSHAAANQATAFSRLGERTVLVDADLRARRGCTSCSTWPTGRTGPD